jgi:uncharacterized protein (TIGR00251 family)
MNEKPAADPLPLALDGHEGISIVVRVIPRAPRTEISGLRNGALLVRLAAPPVDDAANDALLEFFARILRCPRRYVELASGARSRDKRVRVTGVPLAEVEAAVRRTM